MYQTGTSWIQGSVENLCLPQDAKGTEHRLKFRSVLHKNMSVKLFRAQHKEAAVGRGENQEDAGSPMLWTQGLLVPKGRRAAAHGRQGTSVLHAGLLLGSSAYSTFHL